VEDEKHIQLAWNICNLISQLNDLLWEHYEDKFIEQQEDNVVYRGSLAGHMDTEDF